MVLFLVLFFTSRYTVRGFYRMYPSYLVIRLLACLAACVEHFGSFRTVIRGVHRSVRVICVGSSLFLSFHRRLPRRLYFHSIGVLPRYLRSPCVARGANARDSIPRRRRLSEIRVYFCRPRCFHVEDSVLFDRFLRDTQRRLWLQLRRYRVGIFFTLRVHVRHTSSFLKDRHCVVRYHVVRPILHGGLANSICRFDPDL